MEAQKQPFADALQNRCSKFAKFLKIAFSTEHLPWLLLKVVVITITLSLFTNFTIFRISQMGKTKFLRQHLLFKTSMVTALHYVGSVQS